MTYVKVGKSRYSVETPQGSMVIFKDSYTGLWRTRYTDAACGDWSVPVLTLREAKEKLENCFDFS